MLLAGHLLNYWYACQDCEMHELQWQCQKSKCPEELGWMLSTYINLPVLPGMPSVAHLVTPAELAIKAQTSNACVLRLG